MSKKLSNPYICSECFYQSGKWLGKCPECNGWNTFSSETMSSAHEQLIFKINDIEAKSATRIQSGIKEWDRVMGGGLVAGEFAIITGDPGIGKSTLLLQIANKISANHKTIYFSSEESLEQVKLRAQRLNCNDQDLFFSDQADIDVIIKLTEKHKPELIIIDSVQNCYMQNSDFSHASQAQLKEIAFKLMRLAKEKSITIISTGHITKEGVMAGPKTLEHIVDAVFYLQAEDRFQTRILRAVKNRFGTIDELGFFLMNENGLEEIANINKYFMQDLNSNPGSALVGFIEGTRPILVELQALVLASKYAMPQKVISGIDQTQVVLIAAILEKHLQIKLSLHDIFFKISGGLKIKGSSSDLAIALALLSSYFQKPLPEKSLALGEINLAGQIKSVNYINMYINEAEKFGIQNLLLSSSQKAEANCKITKFKTIYDLLLLFE